MLGPCRKGTKDDNEHYAPLVRYFSIGVFVHRCQKCGDWILYVEQHYHASALKEAIALMYDATPIIT